MHMAKTNFTEEVGHYTEKKTQHNVGKFINDDIGRGVLLRKKQYQILLSSTACGRTCNY